MDIFPRRSLFLWLSCLALGFLLLSLAQPATVRADVGVHPLLPGGSSLKPDKNTPIQMLAETVTMDVRLATTADNKRIDLNAGWYGFDPSQPWYPAVAEVHASFSMYNPTSTDIDMPVWFPLACTLKTFGWQDVGLNNSYEATGLSLQDDVAYYATVKGKTYSGMEGAPGSSNGVIIDTQKPVTPTVSDEGDYTNDGSQLSANWTSSSNSGIKEYQYGNTCC